MIPIHMLCAVTLCLIKYSSSLNTYNSCDSRRVVNDLLTIVENTTVSVTSSKTTEFTFIERQNLSFSNYTQWCLFTTRGNSCKLLSTTNHLCYCDSGNDLPGFRKAVFKSDSSRWRWRWSHSGTTLGENIMFNILEAICVTNLELNGHDRLQIIHDNESVGVHCLQENGNTTYTVCLLNRNNYDVNSSINIGTVTYTFDNVSCSQAGVFWCMENASPSHTSETFLRIYTPEFGTNITVKRNETITHIIEISTTVHMHTSHIAFCQLSKYSEQATTGMTSADSANSFSISSLLECSTDLDNYQQGFVEGKQCHCHISGTPPNLTFTIFFYNVIKGDTGNWRVTLSNQESNGYFNFSLQVDEGNASINGKTSEQEGNREVLFTLMGTVSVVTITAVVIISMAVIRHKRIKNPLKELSLKWDLIFYQ